MAKQKGLVIIHVDGLGYDYLLKGLEQARMPFVSSLLANEGYQVQRYRSGVPSLTPYVQAGILYGDNREIPSFRWWDKQSGLLVAFGGFSTFKHVAHKYFRHAEPLTAGGASIATCYPTSASTAYGLGYQERGDRVPRDGFSYRHVLSQWASNPRNLLQWGIDGVRQVGQATLDYGRARWQGQPAASQYVVSDLLEEIFMHQLTRVAVIAAMEARYPVIYGAFYAYDETSHAYGPESDYSFNILSGINQTIQRIASQRQHAGTQARDYELVILSDHGQIETEPFQRQYGCHLADRVAEWLPTYEVDEVRGKKITPREAIDGHVVLTYSGGLAHLYFRDLSWRLEYDEVEERFPGFVDHISRAPGIGLVTMRAGMDNLLIKGGERIRFRSSQELPRPACEVLGEFGEPEVLARQLHKLNSFERSGDLILFGDYVNQRQINFENQVGGHGCLGGEQQAPFIMAKPEYELNPTNVTDASELYPQLRRLRDRLAIEST